MLADIAGQKAGERDRAWIEECPDGDSQDRNPFRAELVGAKSAQDRGHVDFVALPPQVPGQ